MSFSPDWACPPGETLREILEERGLTQAWLAREMGRPLKTINEIIKGKTAITPLTALGLEKIFIVPAEFWMSRELNYQLRLIRLKKRRPK